MSPISRREASVSYSMGKGIATFDCIYHVPRVLGYNLTTQGIDHSKTNPGDRETRRVQQGMPEAAPGYCIIGYADFHVLAMISQ
jgi:hypothetical protein